MSFLKLFNYNLLCILMGIIIISSNVKASSISYPHEGIAHLSGSVISTPCSIVMSNKYQVIDFSSLTLPVLSSKTLLDEYKESFDIQLINCGNVFSSIDSKTWTIRFEGDISNNSDSFLLQGPSKGLNISLYDEESELIYPGKIYPIKNSILRIDKKEPQLYLRYFIKLGLTGDYIQAGSYQGIIRFSIDYQ